MKRIIHAAKKWESIKDYKTVMATFITHLNSINVGMCQGYSAVLLPQLLSTTADDAITINSEEASWIAGFGVLSNPVGALLSGILMDMCGRKATICYTTLPFLFGWTLIGLSEDIYTLCIGRTISGLAIGMASSCYVYVAEISTPSSRGFLSAVGPVFVSFGVLIVYSLGYIINWKAIAFVCAAVAVITFLATLFVPESPSWLATNDSLKEATSSLQWFRRDRTTTEAELADILEIVKISRNSKPRTIKELVQLCKRGSVWKPFLILITFFALQELSGIYVVLYYAVDFFHNVGVFFNDYVASIMVGVLRFLVSIGGAVCIQFFNRKLMATWSCVLMAASMAAVAFYEHIYAIVQFEHRPMAWIPFVGILLNVSASMLGMLQLPWLMVGELFPLAIRGIMGGLVTSLAYLFIFVTVKFYPLLMENLKIDGTMWIFCVASIVAAVFASVYLPETKDKTLFQIEKAFSNSQNVDSKENLRSSIITRSIPTISLDIERQSV